MNIGDIEVKKGSDGFWLVRFRMGSEGSSTTTTVPHFFTRGGAIRHARRLIRRKTDMNAEDGWTLT